MVNFCECVFLFVYYFMMELNLRFGGKDLGLLELNTMLPLEGIHPLYYQGGNSYSAPLQKLEQGRWLCLRSWKPLIHSVKECGKPPCEDTQL